MYKPAFLYAGGRWKINFTDLGLLNCLSVLILRRGLDEKQ